MALSVIRCPLSVDRFRKAFPDNGERTTDNVADIRLARPHELPAVLDLLTQSRLPEAGLGRHAASLLVAVDGDRIVGCAALELYGSAALLRSVAVAEAYRREGLGRRLTQAALDLGRSRGVGSVYLLTETAAGWFSRIGFRQVPRAQAEPAVGASLEFTHACPTSATCMVLSLEPAAAAGYTLIETVIAIVVFGILLSVAWVRMGPALASSRVRNAATVIATDLQYAQMLAVRQRRPVAVIVDPSMRSYIIRLRDSSLTFRNRFFGQDTEFLLDSLSASPTSVVLFPSGVTAGTVTFTARQGGFTRHVRLTRAGQVRIVP